MKCTISERTSTMLRAASRGARSAVVCALFCCLSIGCEQSNDLPVSADKELLKLISEQGHGGDPTGGFEAPDIDSDIVQLGKALFYTKGLSGDLDVACASCHWPTLGGGDAVPLSIGVDAEDPDVLGPSRRHSAQELDYDGGPNVPRNAPTVFNIALWDTALFHDGRVESRSTIEGSNGEGTEIFTPDSKTPDPTAGANLTQAQAKFPFGSDEEMRGFTFPFPDPTASEVRKALAERLGGFGNYPNGISGANWTRMFQQTFASEETGFALINMASITEALAAFEQTMIFVQSPWQAFLNGDNTALSDQALHGALLFYKPIDQGGFDCASCHSGPFFTDEEFYNVGFPQVGRGKDSGPNLDQDPGRHTVTKNPEDLYAFRTPTLLNIEVTEPYGHSGTFPDLSSLLRYHIAPFASFETMSAVEIAGLQEGLQVANWKENTRAVLDHLKQQQAMGRSPFRETSYTEKEIRKLQAFLLSLTDPCVLDEQCLQPWMPEIEKDPTGLALNPIIP